MSEYERNFKLNLQKKIAKKLSEQEETKAVIRDLAKG